VGARQEVGLARRTDFLLAEAQLGEDEANLTRARNDLEVALQRLEFLLGEPPAGPLLDDIEIPSTLGDEPPGSEEALARRSDMKQLDRQLAAARYRLSAARGEYLPSVDLEGRAYVDRHNASTFAEETDWTAEVTVSVPVFDGGRARASVLDATAALERSRLNREERARQVALEVETAWRTLQSDLARLRTLETSLASADENYRLVEEEYRGGLATNLEVIAAQNLLLSTRLERERQRYQVKLDAVALDLVRGVMDLEEKE
jgi:outer membrane protein